MGPLPEAEYLQALLEDLAQDVSDERMERPTPRPLASIFIGGGTPSLLSGTFVAALLHGIGGLVALAPDAEITLEVNPGTVDAERLAAYRAAGVNRLSIGAQSLSAPQLRQLGRIHTPDQVRAAVAAARTVGFEALNLDLMYGLPGQDLAVAAADLTAAIALGPEHLSYYQLTIEPDTIFARQPPRLPDEDLIAEMHLAGIELLAAAGFHHYEVSAFARPGHRCRHNLNYWEFGDYLGIGAGAHGKRTSGPLLPVQRCAKHREPDIYLAARATKRFSAWRQTVEAPELALEFMMNALRLTAGFPRTLFTARTGLPFEQIAPQVAQAQRDGLLHTADDWLRPTALGQRFLNDLLAYFAPP